MNRIEACGVCGGTIDPGREVMQLTFVVGWIHPGCEARIDEVIWHCPDGCGYVARTPQPDHACQPVEPAEPDEDDFPLLPAWPDFPYVDLTLEKQVGL